MSRLPLVSIINFHFPIGDSPQLKIVINGKYLIALSLKSFFRNDNISDGVPDGEISVNFKSPLVVYLNEMFATTCSNVSKLEQFCTVKSNSMISSSFKVLILILILRKQNDNA